MQSKKLPIKFGNLPYGEFAHYMKCMDCEKEMLVPCGVTICPICGQELTWADKSHPAVTSKTASEIAFAEITGGSLYKYGDEDGKGALIKEITDIVTRKADGMVDLEMFRIDTIMLESENGETYHGRRLLTTCHGVVLENFEREVLPIQMLNEHSLAILCEELEDIIEEITI